MSQNTYTFPRQLGRLIEHLPTWPSSFTLTCILDLVLRQVIRCGDLQALYGKRIAIHATDVGLHFYFTVQSSGFSAATGNVAPDLTISATAYDFYLLAMRKEDPDTLFFNRRLVVEGDTELGLVAKNTLDAIEHPMLKLERIFPKHLLARMKARLWV
ncbi:MAG: SCP2 sterol-binding domain-containing protein [Methylotenera sp.]|nr:SCP2 sterol-binding domain-containing protein [Methylotenera sp.]